MKMRIYSGTSCLCDVGIKTGHVDMDGRDLFTGDIVQLWHGNFIGTDCEEWLPWDDGLTAIVSKQYQSYNDGSIVLLDENAAPFTMGIADCGISNHEWQVKIIKSHSEIIDGERFKAYGFNYKIHDN